MGCRSLKDKREMLRICKSKNGKVFIDESGKAPGRGAYVCSMNCLDEAMKKGAIGRSLRTRFENGFNDLEKAAIGAYFSDMGTKSCKE